MSTTNANRKNSSGTTTAQHTNRNGVRPAYVRLGVDTNDVDHVFDTRTDTVHLIHPDGSRGRRVIGEGQSVDDWVDAVDNAHGWSHRTYGLDAYVDSIFAMLEGER